MSHLYNNKKQEKLFHLHDPEKSTSTNCAVLKLYFPNFLDCEKSYVLAQPTEEFNCIGWAIGVKEFIDPTKQINKYYNEKMHTGDSVSVRYANGATSSISLNSYKKDTSACLKAAKLFFDEYNENSVLPKKDNYIAVDKISQPPLDDTIAFYFKEGEETFDGHEINYKGFQHAARYVEDVNNWVSDIWTSKLGPAVLITHKEHELDGETYGRVLCYLVPNDNGVLHDDL